MYRPFWLTVGVNKKVNILSLLGRNRGYTVKYSTTPEGLPEKTSKGKGLYMTVNPESSPYTGSISFFKIIMLMIPSLISLTISPLSL